MANKGFLAALGSGKQTGDKQQLVKIQNYIEFNKIKCYNKPQKE